MCMSVLRPGLAFLRWVFIQVSVFSSEAVGSLTNAGCGLGSRCSALVTAHGDTILSHEQYESGFLVQWIWINRVAMVVSELAVYKTPMFCRKQTRRQPFLGVEKESQLAFSVWP